MCQFKLKKFRRKRSIVTFNGSFHIGLTDTCSVGSLIGLDRCFHDLRFPVTPRERLKQWSEEYCQTREKVREGRRGGVGGERETHTKRVVKVR